MDAMTHMAGFLGSIVKTPQEKRQAKNRRYYERNREEFLICNRVYNLYIRPIAAYAKLFKGAT